MNFWQIVRDFLSRRRPSKRLKPERVQKKSFPPFDVPMTLERIQDRGAHLSKNWNLLTSVTGIQFHYQFASFQEAASFVHREVGKIAEASGFAPVVEIDGKNVVLTLGIQTPQILSEGDFDFAETVDGVVNQPEPPAATD